MRDSKSLPQYFLAMIVMNFCIRDGWIDAGGNLWIRVAIMI